MKVETRVKLSGDDVDKLFEYYEEYLEEIKLAIGDRLSEFIAGMTEVVMDGNNSSVEFDFSELLKDMPHPRISPRRNPYTPTYKIEGKMAYPNYETEVVNDASVAASIGKAIRHAERVSKRDHIKADRIERVNQFVVSLRRELGHLASGRNGMLTGLLDKAMWHDIGVMTTNFNPYSGVSRDKISRWLTEAKRLKLTSGEAMRYEIEGDLEELERGLAGPQMACEEAKRVNQEGEELISRFFQVFA